MPRLNIEDRIYRDGRFQDLLLMVGDRYKALGICVAAWTLAQTWFNKSPHRTIPLIEWKTARIPYEFIQVGLAVIEESGVYVKGSRDEFAWLLSCSESGRRGGLKSKGKIPSHPQATLRVPQASSSFSFSNSKKEEEEESGHHRLLIQIWNERRKSLQIARSFTLERERLAKERWAENPDVSYWEQVVATLASSQFANGKNEWGWKADFDWLLKEGNHVKTLEGKYGDVVATKSKSATDPDAKNSHGYTNEQLEELRFYGKYNPNTHGNFI